MSWHLIVGAAGCAKTTTLTAYVQRAVERVGREWTYVCSLTRAAAVEIGSRLVDPDEGTVDKRRVNTIHGLAYHALDHPDIAVAAKHVAEWNTAAPSQWRVTPADNVGEAPATADEKRSTYDALSFMRATMTPRERWPRDVIDFADAWTSFKRDRNLMDFSDLLENIVAGTVNVPCRALLVDEAQDLSALELATINRIAHTATIRVAAGDPVQALYGWRGGNPDLLFDASTAASVRTLDKSYRVPRAIQQRAEAIARGLAKVDRRHEPRDGDDGTLAFTAPWKTDDAMRVITAALADAEQYGMPSMLLATTHEFVKPWLAVMYEAGIPFHNPFRPAYGYWNPLTSTTTRRVLSFLAPVIHRRLWTGPELYDWVEHLVVQGTDRTVHGGKVRAKALAKEHPGVLTPQVLSEVLTDEAAVAVLAILEREPPHGAVAWLAGASNVKFEKTLNYRSRILRREGVSCCSWNALTATPRIIPSTVHGVKGGEAGAVYLRPDMTSAQQEDHQKSRGMARVFYVAITRARHAAHVLAPTRVLHGLEVLKAP